MTDYTELVRKLRDLHRDPRPASAVWLFDNQVALYDAAAAIEALQAEAKWPITLEQAIDRLRELGWLQEHDRILTEPKRGEWKKISQHEDGTSDYECSACLGIIEDVPDDDEHPLVAYCPMCGAKMKEVQIIKSVTMREGDTDTDGFFMKAVEAVTEVQE